MVVLCRAGFYLKYGVLIESRFYLIAAFQTQTRPYNTQLFQFKKMLSQRLSKSW